MITRVFFAITLITAVLLARPAHAQSDSDYHPFLTDTFIIEVGAFFPTQGLDMTASGVLPGEEVDFDGALGLDDSSVTPAVELRWNFAGKWSFWGQAWKVDSKGTDTLTEDITWDDIVFKTGTTVGAGVKFSVARFFFGYELWDGPQYEIGLGVGLHWMKTKAFIEGQIFSDNGDSDFQRGETSISAPLPNIGAWYYYSPASKWLLGARVDWLDASIGDYNGSLWNLSAGLDYQFADHWGLSLSYQFFKLDVGVDSSDWNGSIKINNNGPLLALTTNW